MRSGSTCGREPWVSLGLAAPVSSRNWNEVHDNCLAETCTWFFDEEPFRAVWPGFLQVWVNGKRKFFQVRVNFEFAYSTLSIAGSSKSILW